jgi:hypothetical protein
MTFRHLVRIATLLVVALAVALAVVGCTSASIPAPSPAGTQGPASAANPGATPAATSSAGTTAGRTATGTVTVTSGGKVVCVITLKNGTGSCKVSTARYKPGTLQFTGAYSGGGGMKASRSKTISVPLLPAPKKS